MVFFGPVPTCPVEDGATPQRMATAADAKGGGCDKQTWILTWHMNNVIIPSGKLT